MAFEQVGERFCHNQSKVFLTLSLKCPALFCPSMKVEFICSHRGLKLLPTCYKPSQISLLRVNLQVLIDIPAVSHTHQEVCRDHLRGRQAGHCFHSALDLQLKMSFLTYHFEPITIWRELLF